MKNHYRRRIHNRGQLDSKCPQLCGQCLITELLKCRHSEDAGNCHTSDVDFVEYEALKTQHNALQAEKNSFKQQLDQANNQYNSLAKSKLGRIQVAIWQRRGRKKWRNAKHLQSQSAGRGMFNRMKNYLRRYPFIVSLVRQMRGTHVPKIAPPAVIAEATASTPKNKQALVFDLAYINRIEPLIENIPISNSGRYYKKASGKIAFISDEFLYNTYKDVAHSVALHPDNWREQITGSDMLFIITGWKGFDEEWRGFSTEGSRARNIILEIITHCKNILEIPTVFYSIEDPPNYPYFVGIARHCNYVFTTAAEVVPDYMRDCGHERVYPLMFGINPLFHNPVGSRSAEKLPDVLFAGSWMDKYPERSKDICTIFDGVIASSLGLKVINRNFHIDEVMYKFPDKYAPYISPAVPHEVLQRIHKLYNWAINMNSVKESTTMFANRVYELEATGNIQLSNYSVAVNSHLPMVYTVQDTGETARIINSLSDIEVQERQAAGIRHAMTGNTCFDRYAELCSNVGISVDSQERNAAIVVNEINGTTQALFEMQSYPYKELVLSDELARYYNKFDIIAFFNEAMDYDVFYLEDMINGFKYTDSSYITKDSYFSGGKLVKGRQHDFVQGLHSKFCTVFWAEDFSVRSLLDMPDGYVELANGYSADCLHFDMRPVASQPVKREYKLSVILPVYNNGQHLFGKSFASLLRSSMFEDMEIIFVDDGSTDGITELYIKYIEKRYDNVMSYFFRDGGSGSASRPRNKGVELASADYIAFLDSDDEAIGDGYAQMLDIAVSERYDLVVGNMLRFRKQREVADYYSYFENYYGSDSIEGDKKEFLKKVFFTPMSIQSMVIAKQMIIENNLKQVVGAFGEDSFYSWQLITNSTRIKAVNFPIFVYYASVAGSVTNTIGKEFFRKSLLLEQIQFSWLQSEGLLNDYMSIRFNNFFRDWYLQKLSQCKTDEINESTEIVNDIFRVYRAYYNGRDADINEFISSYLPYDVGFFTRIESALNKIPVSNSGRFYRKAEQKVAIVADEFFYNSFKAVANVIALHPSHWENQLEESSLLLVVATWRGIEEEWLGVSEHDSDRRKLLLNIINYSKNINIPTVYYGKEDPPDYSVFIELAKSCDHVLTSASEMIPVYRKDCGHNRVYSLMFGINPHYHNPVGSRSVPKLSEVVFSGSWMDKYPERGKDIYTIFDGVLASRRGLKVIDRNYYRALQYKFPSKYAPYISPSISHETLQKVHKMYDWAININSVKDSPTMFANRVYELEAAGNLLLSNYSLGVDTHLPFVYTIKNGKEAAHILNSLSHEELQERQASGIRHAMTGNTCFDRYAQICTYLGLPAVSQKRRVAVVVKKVTKAVQFQFDRQSYPDKELVLEAKLHKRYSQFDMITFFSETMDYDVFYLEDMVNGFKYTDSDYVTKDSYYAGNRLVEGRQHDFVQGFVSKYCTVFWREAFTAQTLFDMPETSVELPNGYSIDCLHFNTKQQVQQLPVAGTYKISVVIPVYNNGLHLYGKAFSSLLRHRMFHGMEIIIVDGGSTDGVTPFYVRYIESRYGNVKAFFLEDGGKGSDLRAREKGEEVASGEQVVFLNPENEIKNDLGCLQ